MLYRGGPRVIMIQICIAIAALALQLKTWDTVIEDVVAAVSGLCTQQSGEAVIQFLAVLPEEAYDGRRMIFTVQMNLKRVNLQVLGCRAQLSHCGVVDKECGHCA